MRCSLRTATSAEVGAKLRALPRLLSPQRPERGCRSSSPTVAPPTSLNPKSRPSSLRILARGGRSNMPGPYDDEEFDLEIEPDGETSATPPAPKAPPASHEEMVEAYDEGRRRSLASDMEEHGALGDLATIGLSGVLHTPRARVVSDAEERTAERGRNLWDTLTLSDERLG